MWRNAMFLLSHWITHSYLLNYNPEPLAEGWTDHSGLGLPTTVKTI